MPRHHQPDIASIDTVRQDLARHRLHCVPPVGSEYRFGRVHRDRGHYKGFLREAKEAVKRALGKGGNGADRKFLILARPRSGTTLLVNLLSQVPDLSCGGEIFHYAVMRPQAYLKTMAQNAQTTAYGAKLLSYQMFEIQRMADQVRFLEAARDEGFCLIHVRRDTFSQSLSLARALESGRYHSWQAGKAPPSVDIDEGMFHGLVDWNAAMLDYEDRLMAAFPHLVLNYETDLIGESAQQTSVDAICEMMGHPSGPVVAQLSRVSKQGQVSNIEALRQIAQEAGA